VEVAEQETELSHNQKVEKLKEILTKLNLPVLPLNTVKCGFYVPDVVTRINQNFVVMDFINSRERIPYDIGGLCLIYNKDIVDFCLGIIDDTLWKENEKELRKVVMNLPPKLKIIKFGKVREWFAEQAEKSNLWKP